jgi:antirestriction protein ArdC
MSRKEAEKSRNDIYERVTERIASQLEEGVRPWVQPWSAKSRSGQISRPMRHNGEPYSGMNVLLLWSEAMARGFSATIWMTFKQASELGAHVRKGETSSTVIYAGRFTKTETNPAGDEVERDIPFLRTYGVFNVEQIDGLPDNFHRQSDRVPEPVERIKCADRFFANVGAKLRHGGNQAYYAPATDHIQMPPRETFRDAGSYAAVLAHEHVHWTANPIRVGRDLSRYARDRTERAREELVAEIGSALLCADLGIVPELEPRPDHAAYIGEWLKVLKDDKRAVFQAAAHAQRAANYLHDRQPSHCQEEAAA